MSTSVVSDGLFFKSCSLLLDGFDEIVKIICCSLKNWSLSQVLTQTLNVKYSKKQANWNTSQQFSSCCYIINYYNCAYRATMVLRHLKHQSIPDHYVKNGASFLENNLKFLNNLSSLSNTSFLYPNQNTYFCHMPEFIWNYKSHYFHVFHTQDCASNFVHS